jgi:TPR repeat protein
MRRILLGLATTVFLGLFLVTILIFISLHGAPDGRSQVGPARACDLAVTSPHDLARPSGIPGTGADDIDLAVSASECEAASAKAPQDPRLLFETGGVADVGGDADKALALYEQAAGQGYGAAQARLGEFYQIGLGGLSRDDDEAARLYKLSAGQGDTAGQVRLGYFYEAGRGGLPRNDEEAARLYALTAGQGNAEGEACLGDLYRDGGGLPRDDSEAARRYRLAAEGGDADGQASLGALDENGLGGLTRNDDEAARRNKLAADQGHAVGRNNLGNFYRDGFGGVTKDDDEAAHLFWLAADQGNPYGQLNLAYFYENGRGGLPRDSEEAARLYELAAAQDVKDQNVMAAPTTAAKIAYDYLQDHYTSNGIVNYNISTYDNNVCHLRYLFFAESDFNIKYDFDAADIRLDTVKSVPPRQGGALGIGFAGIDLDAAPGRHFKADGRIKRASLPPAASSIRLLATIQPDASMVQALVKLATECGAKPPPSSVVQ